jgi:transcriptional regulator with XRE-family HTH domain
MNNDTHKMNADDAPYVAFGRLLAQLRQKVGIAQQSQLAELIEMSQQTVSRWEAGSSRPRANQIPLLARVLQTNAKELFAAAGYAPKATVASFDRPFPVDGLSPESFERFCQSFLEYLYPEAITHAVGGQGHTQEGADIDVTYPDRTCLTFQCKRMLQFGPRDVDKAVAEHTRQSAKKFILLSRVASPRTRAAIRQHSGWDIWDKEDISRRVRALPPEQQLRLVMTFFPEQRFALLGVTAEGRWQTIDEFFAPYMGGRGAFSHDWPLIGRVDELATLLNKLGDDQIKVLLLTGTGGGGKSRVLKEALEKYQAAHKALMVRFLSPTQQATGDSLKELGEGAKLLVVDDAHDRGDLPLLFQYVAAPENNARFVLSLRPYGRDYISFQAANFALSGASICEVVLPPLTLTQATELARQALERFGGPVGEAESIARLTLDCSLATVIGAQVVATDHRHFELVKNEEAFRSTLLGKFQDIIAGRIGPKSDTDLVRKVLRVLALVQPFYPDDQTILQVVATVEGIEAHDVSRIIRALTEAGVLFRRGGRYRLSPDLLADHIVEKACIGVGGLSTGYAERVFAAAGDQYIEHVLLNLGRLDWRLANGRPSNSRLLDGIWGQLAPSTDYGDPYIKAVTAVAYFQPERALSLAEKLIREGQYLRDLPELIKYAAYTHEFTKRACECLWELGKSDSRQLGPHPGHAIRVLSDLCAVRPDKPIRFNDVVVDFGLSLLQRDDAWSHKYSPFDILKGILHPDGHTAEALGPRLAIKNFSVNIEAVTALRARVFDAVIRTLAHSNPRAAVLAAQALHEALRYPMNITLETQKKWTADFVRTLDKVERAIRGENIDPLVLVEIAHAISWHAHHGVEETSAAAHRILGSLPHSLEFRTLLALADGHGHIIERYTDYREHAKKWGEYLSALVADLLQAYPDGEVLRAYLAGHVAHIKAYHSRASSSPYVLYWRLITASLPLAQATVNDALAHEQSPTRQFVATALVKIAQNDRAVSLAYMKRFAETGAPDLRAAVGSAFGLFGPEELPLTAQEIAILRSLLGANDEWIAHCAVSAVRSVAKGDDRFAIDLLKGVDIGISHRLADEVFMNFAAESGGLLGALTPEDVDVFLNRLMALPELEGYWVETFLAAVSGTHAPRLAKFFMDRVAHAATIESWDYRPCNYGPYGHVPLQFRRSPDFGLVLRKVSDWMKSRGDLLFMERSAQLFDTMFSPFDEVLVTSLQRWADIATEADIRTISKILGQAPSDFVFEHRAFVIRFVERAKQFGKGVLDEATSELLRSAISGVRSGNLGEPTPEDLAAKEGSAKAVADLPRFSPAFALYESIAKHTDWRIDISIRDGEAFEEQ